ncbi:hypothetical protein [Lignipirellula cremea]|uniref:Uncharacterized protein n=1 Tax=Lignipirellula cremea TaxID=2528010 RepID=A0A518DZZ9_9BACT|nr:hypothetical protein [Lignipirellula cremea]QDU97412.1 hypothetical protein Pla8534_52600 [Lignipirellula cremea]
MTEGNGKEYEVGIRIAGNTLIPCLQAIAAKGYSIKHYFLANDPNDWDHPQRDAEKDTRLFSATSPAELLGLIAMWEVRGDDWQIKNGESALYDQLVESAAMYDDDGNVLDT